MYLRFIHKYLFPVAFCIPIWGKGCPKQMLYWFTVMTSRLICLHYILNFFKPKWEIHYKWLVANNKGGSGILEIFLDFDDIKTLPEQSFKIFVNEQVLKKAFQYLQLLKAKHSIVDHIKHTGFNMQEYFLPENV